MFLMETSFGKKQKKVVCGRLQIQKLLELTNRKNTYTMLKSDLISSLAPNQIHTTIYINKPIYATKMYEHFNVKFRRNLFNLGVITIFDQQPNHEPIFFIFLSYSSSCALGKIWGANNAPTIWNAWKIRICREITSYPINSKYQCDA